MKLNKFYKTVADVVLHPGSVDALNDQERRSNTGKTYEEVRLDRGKRYLEGIVLPEMSSIEETMRVMINAVSPEDERYVKDMLELLSGVYSGVTELDLRLKVKKLGADGLVHVRYVGQSKLSMRHSEIENLELGQYIGVPVRLMQ